jgi:dienelactone hydrolase
MARLKEEMAMKYALATWMLFIAMQVGAAEDPRLEIEPIDAMIYEAVDIHVLNVPDEGVVSVHAMAVDADSVLWASTNRFRARGGRVHLSEHAPENGTYDGVSSMGFIWSMTPQGDDAGRPLMFATPGLEPLSVDLKIEVGDHVFERQLIRRMVRPGVRREDVREDGLVATMFLPADTDPQPAIVCLGGSGGGLWEEQAALLASERYVALSLAYFGIEELPKTLDNIPLEYFETAIRYLQGRPEVDADRMAVLGASRGGELALLLGATYPQIKGVLAYSPSGLVWFGMAKREAAWTLGGEPVPFVTASADPQLERAVREKLSAGQPASWRPAFESTMEKELKKGSDAIIAVEKTNGPILMLSGEDDRLWPSGPLSEVARRRLEERDFDHTYEHISYPETGHIFPPPYLPAMFSQNQAGFIMGGTPEGTAHAQEDCWRRTLTFLERTFR